MDMSAGTQAIIELFKQHDELEIINTPLDIYLEIPHLAYLEVKKPNGGKALLFTNPIDSRNKKHFDIPVFMNIFGSFKRLELITKCNIESIAIQIKDLLNLAPPRGLLGFFEAFRRYSALRFSFPKLVRKASAQTIVQQGSAINLYDFPILTTWEGDGAPFITMGQVYTQSLDGKKKNLGMYRLQVHSRNTLGLHWQIHKDSTHFFDAYKKAGQKMPVSIAIGGDPLYTWCGQAPLPNGIYELMLYGLIKKQRPKVVRCLSNPLSVPSDADIVIEGWVDTNYMQDEGPFGDHTGFYTHIESYPVLEVSAITHQRSPIYHATVVGKPPLEDKYMGYLTERVFLPLLQTSAHGLIDYNMPENGVFHNLIFAKIAPQYPGHAKQIMHAFWGVGQMSFVKHAIFVGEEAPKLNDYEALLTHILDRFSTRCLVISEGVCDALDHSSPEYAYGGKLGLDVSMPLKKKRAHKPHTDKELCVLLSTLFAPPITIAIVRQYGLHTQAPIAIIGVEGAQNLDTESSLESTTKPTLESNQVDSASESSIDLAPLKSPLLKCIDTKALGALAQELVIGILVDAHKNDLENPYMLVWRIVNNIDSKRDVLICDTQVLIDATDKPYSSADPSDSKPRKWPKETDCSPSVIQSLIQKGFTIDSTLLHRYHICTSPSTNANP